MDVNRQSKASLYAKAGIIDYRVVNVSEQVIHVLREPNASGDGTMNTIAQGKTITPIAAAEAELELSALLG